MSDWRVNGLVADSGDFKPYPHGAGGLNDVAEATDDALNVRGVTAAGSENVDFSVSIPKDTLLELFRNAGWLDRRDNEHVIDHVGGPVAFANPWHHPYRSVEIAAERAAVLAERAACLEIARAVIAKCSGAESWGAHEILKAIGARA